MGEGLGERAFRPAPRGPVLPPSGEKNEAPGRRALRPAPRAPVVPPSGEKAQDEGPRERVSRPTPRAPLLLPSEEKAESEGPDERALRPAPRAWIPDEGRIPDIREPAPHLEPAASLTDETNSDARERDTRLAPCAPDERWPELPETRWSEPSWEVPSSQSLVRLQQRLVRLQAEQAGSSWSGRHS